MYMLHMINKITCCDVIYVIVNLLILFVTLQNLSGPRVLWSVLLLSFVICAG